MSAATRTVRVAAAAYPLDGLATLSAVEDKIARWVAEAAGAGAEVLAFPEYGAMELAAPAGEPVCADLQASLGAVSDALPRIDAVHADLARRHGIHILAGSGPRREADGRYRNTARLFAPSGKSGRQDKLIRTPFERDWGLVAGEKINVFETALGRIGVAICYDSEFPLLVRAMVEADAEIILIPACTELVSGYHRVRTAALARALEGGCATVVSPTVRDFHLVTRSRRQLRCGRHLCPRRSRPFRYRRPRGRRSERGGLDLRRRRPRGAGSTCRYRRNAQPRRLAPSAGRRSGAAES